MLVLEIYKHTTLFPEIEKYYLTQQIRRSAVSISSNIVEGKSKNTDKEFMAYLFNGRGSLEETRYHLLLAKDLNYLDITEYESLEKLSVEVSVLLNSLIKSIAK